MRLETSHYAHYASEGLLHMYDAYRLYGSEPEMEELLTASVEMDYSGFGDGMS